MSRFKFYLGRILGSYNEKEDSSGPLCLYQQRFRSLIGEVLTQSENLGPPDRYMPLFYQYMELSDTKIFAEVHQ